MMGVADMEMKTSVVKPTRPEPITGSTGSLSRCSSRWVQCLPWASASLSFLQLFTARHPFSFRSE